LVIITRGGGTEKTAVKAMKAGACDYLIKDNNRNYLKLLPVIIESVIENKKNKEKVKKFDQLRSEFVMTLSHELKTPLSVLKAIVCNITENELGDISSELRHELNIADQNIDRLTRMITDFIDISKVDFGKLKLHKSCFGIQQLISEVVTTLTPITTKKNIELSYFVPDQDIAINADRDRIIEVLTNLIENATKYGLENGRITLYVEEDNEAVHFKVSDNGPGIDKKDINSIFDRFVQIEKVINSDKTSIGLGLPLVKEIVELHEGYVWVESEPGKGCTFGFTLPKLNVQEIAAPAVKGEKCGFSHG
ncbi:MAG: hypothetical protein H8D47_04885, partial [Planctomycetes bacterium]|nr:hypothetical protein [Planctomycetota bacterium]